MNQKSIKLKESSILHVPINKYANNFTFIINNEKYETNIFVADLLSPKLSKYHMIDSTIDSYSINTINRGNFENILKLVNFEEETINDNEIPFFIEILNELENTSQQIQFCNSGENIKNEDKETNTKTKILENLSKHMKNKFFFEKEIEEDIKYISSHFYELNEEDKKIIKEYDITILTEIINQEELVLLNEDELIEIINELYKKDRQFHILYSYVYFKNVSKEQMNEFLRNIEYEDITTETWKSLCERLSYEIIQDKNETKYETQRYQKETNNNNQENKKKEQNPQRTITYSNEGLNGIISYLQKENNIKDEINISYSSKNCSTDPWFIFNYNGGEHHFFTNIEDNPWICIEFKNHEIKPTSYTIRSGCDNDNPKSIIFEGSNDKIEWKILDEQNDNIYLKGKLSVNTFPIKKEKIGTFKYFRIRLKGKNWNNGSMLQISSIELFGEIY